MSPDAVLLLVLGINGLWVLIVLVAVVAGWWSTRDTRRRDAQIDIDDETAAELRAERRAEW